MLKKLLKFAVVLIAAIIMQHFAFIIADAERGYAAVGSEYFVFPFVMVVGCYGLGIFSDEDEDMYIDDYDDEEENDLDVQYRDAV